MGVAARIREIIPAMYGDNNQYFPNIDYSRHPEYKNFVQSATETDRKMAMEQFKPVMDKLVSMQAKHRLYIAKNSAPKAPQNLKQQIDRLHDDGILSLNLSDRDRKKILELTSADADEIYETRSKMTPSERGVGGVSKRLGRFDEPTETYQFFQSLLEKMNIFELCHIYKKMPYTLKFVALQINDYSDSWISETSSFENGNRSPAFYMHVDSTIDNLKIIFYRTDSNIKETGAFRYIPESYKKYSQEDRAIRKANDKTGFDFVHDIEKIKLFSALPEKYRKKASFGNDLIEGDAQTEFLLNKEKIYGTDVGEGVLFNSDGIHRGCIFTQPAKREIFQLLLAPQI